MITALDTNVLLDILIPNELYFASCLAAIEKAAGMGSLVICDLVYAELCGQFQTQMELDRFLHENAIRVERLERAAMFSAAEHWQRYRKTGGSRERILPDFFVGAHALQQASQLISRDRGFYRKYFSKLVVVDPSR